MNFAFRKILCAVIAAGIVTGFFSCQKNTPAGKAVPSGPVDEKNLIMADEGNKYGYSYANDEALRRAFTLDYRSEKPEPEQPAEMFETAVSSGVSASVSTVEVIPGLRKLSDYKTVYAPMPVKTASESAGRIPPPSNAGPFTVVDWGPQKFLSSAVQRPSIYVIFSQPVVPLAALGASSASPLVSIEPPLKGSFRWYGASFLSFEGDEPCQSQQIYTITVSPDAESVYGIKIEGQTRFSFETERLSMKSIEAGAEFKKETGLRFSNDGVPPAAAKKITINFNYPVKADDIKNYIAVTSGAGGEKNFELTQIDESRLLASLMDDIEFDTRVDIILKQGAKSGGGTLGTAEDQVLSFNTPIPFVVNEIMRLSPWGKYLNLFDIEFSARLNESAAAGAIHTEPAMSLTKENIEVWGNTARIFNLPLDFNEKFKIIVDTGAEDVYGRRLAKRYETEITMPPEPMPVGSVTFLDYGDSMLEAQFEPRLLFEYKNIAEKSFYKLEQKNNPYSAAAQKSNIIYLKNFEKNFRYFEEIDLRPYLNVEGRGFVSFNADINLLQRGVDPKTGNPKTSSEKNYLNLQVTDLGITVRYAFNKAVVMATSLSTGKPVEGAVVKLIAPGVIKDFENISGAESFAESLTDENGLAVLEMSAGMLRNIKMENSYQRSIPFVFAEKDGDRAVFQPSSHNSWRFDIYKVQPEYADRAMPVTFMFSDRGLYKPGETLTFRGVDRSLILGMYAIYSGAYTVELAEDSYGGETVVSLDGVTSESGGYYGSVKLGEDFTPGQYRLRYKRNGGSVCADIPITIAYFERLKFQASISAPAMDIVSGDDINLTLQASYLSGGNLAGAEWRASWSRQLSGFYPNTAETKGFVFGPRNVYDGKRYIASSNGVLSADGNAALSQKTTSGDSVSGAAYAYSVEASVTDISNQEISSAQSVTVHPALFYIGIERPASRGFAKAGDELSFNYITVNTSGKKLDSKTQFLSRGDDAGIINIELIREEWKRVQQRGVNNYIYDNYERTEVIDGAEKTSIKTASVIKV
ncbi:MAG: hypothetical protein LBB22_00375, partial [Treponema sp.]|nr:hypothetical protein [Treponema sp.]